jgi:hypothetical protein
MWWGHCATYTPCGSRNGHHFAHGEGRSGQKLGGVGAPRPRYETVRPEEPWFESYRKGDVWPTAATEVGEAEKTQVVARLGYDGLEKRR